MRIIEKAIYHTTIIILIGVVIYLLIYFFFPIYHGMFADGGTEYWEAKTYTLVHWQYMGQSVTLEDGTRLRFGRKKGWEIYWYPNQDAWEDEYDRVDDLFWSEYNEWLENHQKKEENN